MDGLLDWMDVSLDWMDGLTLDELMDLLCRRQVEGSCQQVWALQAVASQCSPPEYHCQKY